MAAARKTVPIIVAAALALPVTACGGADRPLTAAELVEQGDETCREGRERFDEIQASPPANPQEAVDQTETLIDSTERELAELGDLEPPAELEDAYGRYLDSREAALDVLEQGRDAAERQDAGAYGELQAELKDGAQERHSLAQEVGLTECSLPEGGPAASAKDKQGAG